MVPGTLTLSNKDNTYLGGFILLPVFIFIFFKMTSSSRSNSHTTCLRKWHVALILVRGWWILQTLVKSAVAEEMLSSYTSMRALDKFGNSMQLKHAREAATRHGRLVVAAKSNKHGNGEIGETMVVVSVGSRSVVRSLTLPLLPNDNERLVAMCCTGVKSDADWLIRHMQKYTATVWEHYNHHAMGTPALAYWSSRILGSYQDDDLDDEWQSSIRRVTETTSVQDKLESSLSRPLGVQTMLLSTAGKSASTSTSTISKDEPDLLIVEPTGRIFRGETTNTFSFGSIGKQSEVLRDRLLRSKLNDPEDLEQLLVKEILETLGPSRNEVVELVVETLRAGSGIECTRLQCKNGKVQARSVLTLS